MARTGLRMMPTSPSPPLKFRTAGFPRYGFKASMSSRAFLKGDDLKPAPGIQSPSRSLLPPFARFRREGTTGSESSRICASACRCSGGFPSLPQGPLAPVRVMLSRPIVAYYDPIRQSRRHAATSRLSRLYAAPSLFGSASATCGTFPTFAAVPSVHAADPTPVVRQAFPLYSHWRFQASSNYYRVANPRPPPLPAMPGGVTHFGAASFALCYGLRFCLVLLTGYDEMKSRALHPAF